MTTISTAHEALQSTVGEARVRPGDAGDEVCGVRPSWVVSPADTAEVSAVLRATAEHGLTVVPTGSGSRLDWGAAPRSLDVLLDVSRLRGVVEHAAGDLVVVARAGTPLAEVRREVAKADQQLAIDQPLPTSTVGGLVATGCSGPGRHFFGGVRDLLIGITVVRADGTVTTSGGKVVKNVAGYDLGRLYTGSHGTLGVITEVVFRLHPLAAEHRWISTTCDSPRRAAEVVAELRHCQQMPTAIELDRPRPDGPIEVCAELEGRPKATHDRAERLAAQVGGGVRDTAPSWWGGYPFDTADSGLRLGVQPAELGDLLEFAERAAQDAGVPLALRGAAGLGVLEAGIPGDCPVPAFTSLLEALRGRAAYAVLLRGDADARAAVDPWGAQPPGVQALMNRVKDQFDPEHRLAPGRFVGGI